MMSFRPLRPPVHSLVAAVLWMLAVLTLTSCVASPTAAGRASFSAQYNPHAITSQRPTATGDYYAGIVQVKFDDEYRIRLRSGALVDLNGAAPQDALAALAAATQGGRWERAHDIDEATLDTLRARGEANTGRPLVDINNYFHLLLPRGWDAAHAGDRLQRSLLVERVQRIPVAIPADFDVSYLNPGGITGNVATDAYQRYLDPAPNGIDARHAWNGAGGTGSGIGICDIEQDYNPDHADLPKVDLRGASISFPGQEDDHGTAVLGIVGGRNDGIGVTGIAYNADFYFAYGLYNNVNHTPDGIINTYFLHNAITRCTAAVGSGGAILIEAQIGGPNRPPNPAEGDQTGLVPTEWDESVYDVIQLAVANNITVVEAAGNGAQDLDSADYQTGNGGHYPFLPANDSGAIMVGAGKSPYWGASARNPHDYTNYGQTVDLHGWGDSIVTAGYGTLYPGGANPNTAEKNRWYAVSFGGTSGASPMVAGAVAVVQSTYNHVNGGYMSPAEVRSLLRSTGTPQQGANNIGPLPNLRAAVGEIYSDAGVGLTVAAPAISPAAGAYDMPIQVEIDYGPGQNSGNSTIRYTLDGSEPTPDSFIFHPDQGDSIYLLYGATVKAKAFQFDPVTQRSFASPTTARTYASSTPKVAMPVITPGAGTYSQPHQVTISTATDGATIRYRTDGRTPSFFYPGTLYNGPITLDPGVYEITARGYKDGYYKSDAAESGEIVVNALSLPAPSIYPGSDAYNGSATIYLGSTVLGATIRYSFDGEPDANSPAFTEPIVIQPTAGTLVTTIYAKTFLEGYAPSVSASETYTIVAQPDPPDIVPDSGEFTGTVTVNISTGAAGGVIRYTTDGSEPSELSTQYTGPLDLGPGVHTVKARTFLNNAAHSDVAQATLNVYTNNQAKVAIPRLIPDGGNHTISVTVRMETDTNGADIHYTQSITGQPDIPTQADPLYDPDNPLVLMHNENDYFLRARAFKSGMTPSDTEYVVMRVFSATQTVTTPTVDRPGGVYHEPIQVELDLFRNPPFVVPQLYYTTDGSDPFVPYNTPGETPPVTFNLAEPTRIKALGAQLGWYNSEILDETYLFVCATPAVTPGGVYTGTAQVTMATDTPDATIRYTTDGAEPSGSSPAYTAPVNLGVGTTPVRAKCFRDDFEPSVTVVETFVVQPDPVSPAITSEPQDREIDAGQSVTFTIDVTGTPLPSIQWQFNQRDIAGEIEPELALHDVRDASRGDYRAVVTNAAGSTTSSEAMLTLAPEAIAELIAANSGPAIPGAPVAFTATTAAGSNVTYMWDFGDNSMGSGKTTSHTYANLGVYTATVTASNELSSTSAETVVVIQGVEDVRRIYLPNIVKP